VLVVNAGSSSLKLRVLDARDELVRRRDLPALDGADLRAALGAFADESPPLEAAGHRVVHGGARLTAPVVAGDDVERELERLAELAPLHEPPALAGIRAMRALRPELPQVACFDTAFHATLPAAAATYAVPEAWRRRWGLRRFGFHGLSHAHAARRAAELLGRPAAGLRVVTAHLGAGASLAAVRDGRSVDTTMGFTPLEGLVMATRAGSIDPGLLLYVRRHGDLDDDALERALDRESGLRALSGGSGDMREVLEGAGAGDERCRRALEVYVHRLAAGVAAMAAALGGLDALAFTGGVGEHAAPVRAAACERLAFLGAGLDAAANAADADAVISRPGAGVAVLVVTAREDLEIARQVRALLAPGPR